MRRCKIEVMVVSSGPFRRGETQEVRLREGETELTIVEAEVTFSHAIGRLPSNDDVLGRSRGRDANDERHEQGEVEQLHLEVRVKSVGWPRLFLCGDEDVKWGNKEHRRRRVFWRDRRRWMKTKRGATGAR